MNAANSIKNFRVAARSSNTNSFGLTQHVVVATDGESFSFCRSRGPWHAELAEGTLLQMPTDGEGRVNWSGFGAELVRRLPDAPANVVQSVWHMPV